MIIFVNKAGEIYDVNTNSLSDPTLTEVEITDGTFDGWSVAKICCYKVRVVDGNVVMMTPYVDSRLISHIDQLGRTNDVLTEENITQSEEIEGLGDAIIEMSEIIYS